MSQSPSHRHDLRDRDDIVQLVDRFYEKIRSDEKLGPIFNELVDVDWDTHLPKMYDFWDTVMFRTGKFRGDPIGAHAKLIPKTEMSREMFDHWLDLFRATVAELFEGEKAGHIVRCAEDMANVIYSKINHVPDPRFDPANLSEEQRARYAAYKEGTGDRP
ncbi:MAG: group III truncated hemoglobin [Verrucomicrobiales bacterium]